MRFRKVIDKFSALHLPVFIACFFTVWGLYLRFALRAQKDLWTDEIWQISIIKQNFPDFIRTLPEKAFCSYLEGDYFLTYPFYRIFGDNKWGLAIPHMITTCLGFYLFYLIARKYFKTVWGYLVAYSVFCFNATLIEHALEIRAWSVMPTLALGVFYFGHLLIDKKFNFTRWKKFWMGAFFVAVIWFHVYGILMVFLIMLYVLGANRNTEGLGEVLKRNVPFFAVVLLIALPLWFYSVFIEHLDSGTIPSIRPFEFIPNPLEDIQKFLKVVFGTLLGFKKLYFLYGGLLLSVLLPHQDRLKQLAFFLILVIFPIELILMTDLKNKYWFIQRQFIWVMPLFAILLGWCWESCVVYWENRFKCPREKI